LRRSRLKDIVIDYARPSALAAFWAEVLDYRVAPYDDDEIARLRVAGIDDIADDPTVVIEPPDGGPSVWFQQVPEPKIVKNRVHLDIDLQERGGARLAGPVGGAHPATDWRDVRPRWIRAGRSGGERVLRLPARVMIQAPGMALTPGPPPACGSEDGRLW
jgi:hypothetical protein